MHPHRTRGPTIDHAAQHVSLDELSDALRRRIEAQAYNALPSLFEIRLALVSTANLPLHRPAIGPYAEGGESDLPAEFQSQCSLNGLSAQPPELGKVVPYASVQSLIGSPNERSRQIGQRAAARAIVHAIESKDGFRYSFKSSWKGKDDGGNRFSYICLDSVQNKDRHANGYSRTQKHIKGDGKPELRLPTYECRGGVNVRFIAASSTVEVHYKHLAIHPSAEEVKRLASQPRFSSLERPKLRSRHSPRSSHNRKSSKTRSRAPSTHSPTLTSRQAHLSTRPPTGDERPSLKSAGTAPSVPAAVTTVALSSWRALNATRPQSGTQFTP